MTDTMKSDSKVKEEYDYDIDPQNTWGNEPWYETEWTMEALIEQEKRGLKVGE